MGVWRWFTAPRLLTIAAAGAIAAMLILTLVTFVTVSGHYRPISVEGNLAFTQPPEPGKPALLIRPYCSKADVLLVGSVGAVYLNRATDEAVPASISPAVAVYQPGCHISRYRTSVPTALGPGTWQIVGSVYVVKDDRFQQVDFATEPFRVAG